MKKMELQPASLEIIPEDVNYNPKCPCSAECVVHGFCSVCLLHHDRYSDNPPLCMKSQQQIKEQRKINWHPKNTDNKYYGDRK